MNNFARGATRRHPGHRSNQTSNIGLSQMARFICKSLICASVVAGGWRSGNAVADCGCLTCRHGAAANWYCLPQPTTLSAEVTEWGVHSEIICPPHSRLFGSACQCSGKSQVAGCDDGCDASCDAIGNSRRLAGLDTDCNVACDCLAQGECDGTLDSGNHHFLRLPGTGPRPRNKLMRKTLVYSLPGEQQVALPCAASYSTDVCSPICPSVDDTTTTLGNDNGIVWTTGIAPAVAWMDQPATPVTMLLPNIQGQPAPVVTAAELETTAGERKIHWIDGHGVEQMESLGTMESATGIQPPAPISFTPAAAAADVWPFALPSLLNER